MTRLRWTCAAALALTALLTGLPATALAQFSTRGSRDYARELRESPIRAYQEHLDRLGMRGPMPPSSPFPDPIVPWSGGSPWTGIGPRRESVNRPVDPFERFEQGMSGTNITQFRSPQTTLAQMRRDKREEEEQQQPFRPIVPIPGSGSTFRPIVVPRPEFSRPEPHPGPGWAPGGWKPSPVKLDENLAKAKSTSSSFKAWITGIGAAIAGLFGAIFRKRDTGVPVMKENQADHGGGTVDQAASPPDPDC